MRRKDKEIIEKQEIKKILEDSQVIRIACMDEHWPYIFAMNFVYVEPYIYMHSAKAGRKIDILNKNSNVSFLVDMDIEIKISDTGCNCTTNYKSVYGEGNIIFEEDYTEKVKALDELLYKYSKKNQNEYPDATVEKTEVLKLLIKNITGKKSGY